MECSLRTIEPRTEHLDGVFETIFPNLIELRLSTCVLPKPLELAHAINLSRLRKLRLLRCEGADDFFAAVVASRPVHLVEFMFRPITAHSADGDLPLEYFIASFCGLARLYIASGHSKRFYPDFVTAIRNHKESLRELIYGGVRGRQSEVIKAAKETNDRLLSGMDLDCWEMPLLALALVIAYLTSFHYMTLLLPYRLWPAI